MTEYTLQNNDTPCQLNGIKSYTVLDEIVLYSPTHEMAFSLNQTAKAIWQMCDGNHTILEICEELSQQFNYSSADLLPEVKTTIRQFHNFGILE